MLKKIFFANAIFSTLNAIALVFAPQKMTDFLLSPQFSFLGFDGSNVTFSLGIGLFVFAAYVVFVALNLGKQLIHAKIVISADWFWVVLTLLLFTFAAPIFSVSGMVFFSIVAFIVAGFAAAQMKFLKEN